MMDRGFPTQRLRVYFHDFLVEARRRGRVRGGNPKSEMGKAKGRAAAALIALQRVVSRLWFKEESERQFILVEGKIKK